MASLGRTTLASRSGLSASSADNRIALASLSGVDVGDVLVIDCEPMAVRGFIGTTHVQVTRSGHCASHAHGATVYVATPDQLKTVDPVGVPRPFADTPWINVRDRRTWHAQGDDVGAGVGARFWQLETTTFAVGALGVRTATTTP